MTYVDFYVDSVSGAVVYGTVVLDRGGLEPFEERAFLFRCPSSELEIEGLYAETVEDVSELVGDLKFYLELRAEARLRLN
jgi:hypothetical protein